LGLDENVFQGLFAILLIFFGFTRVLRGLTHYLGLHWKNDWGSGDCLPTSGLVDNDPEHVLCSLKIIIGTFSPTDGSK